MKLARIPKKKRRRVSNAQSTKQAVVI